MFFGRERLVAELVARVPGSRLMGIVGPSGSGKSSVLRAGLLAALADGVLPGSENWPLVVIRPGRRPLRALGELPPDGRCVLAVDQFEETFTLCADEAERTRFVDALLRCARDPERSILVILAIRADYYGRCAAYPELSRALGVNHALVGQMHREELRRAIELPARRARLPLEPALADALVDDVAGEPGGLPLLSTALLELSEGELTLAAYERSGGVHSAVAVWPRAHTSGSTRRAASARGVSCCACRATATRARGCRSPSSTPARCSTRSPWRGWSRWATARPSSPTRRCCASGHGCVAGSTRTRRAGGCIATSRRPRATGTRRDAIPAELYRGTRLGAAIGWSADHDDELNTDRAGVPRHEPSCRRAGRSARAEDQPASARAAGGRRAAARGGGGRRASWRSPSASEAEDTALTADAQRLGAVAIASDRLDQAMLLARAGVHLKASAATHGNLLTVLMRQPGRARRVARRRLAALLRSPSAGSLLAIGDDRGNVTVYDAATRRTVSRYRVPVGHVQHLRFTPDAASLVVVGRDAERGPRAWTSSIRGRAT